MYCDNWEMAQKRFTNWWDGKPMDRPLLRIIAKHDSPLEDLEPELAPQTPQEYHLDLNVRIPALRNYCRTHRFMAEAFAAIDLNIGAGSMATYLGSSPIFAWDTVWFKECVEDWHHFSISYNENNPWLLYHLDLFQQAQAMAADDFLVNIPDIVENVDILSALRGPQAFCYDLIDEPELIKSALNKIDDLYFTYYDRFYDIVKCKDNSSSYTAFGIWGPGKTAKVQCDFSAMMSPSQYREFVLPSLQKQCSKLDHSLYHLDGKDAVRHLDAIMEIKNLSALQFTSGAGNPDGGNPQWYPIYEKVRKAGKSLWIYICDGEYEDWVKSGDNVVNAFGNQAIYFLFPTMTQDQGNRLIAHADDKWSK